MLVLSLELAGPRPFRAMVCVSLSLNMCMFALDLMVGLLGITSFVRLLPYAPSCVSMCPWISGTQPLPRYDSHPVSLPSRLSQTAFALSVTMIDEFNKTPSIPH